MLRNKVYQPVTTERAFEKVIFGDRYIGPITIKISNIMVGVHTYFLIFSARIVS